MASSRPASTGVDVELSRPSETRSAGPCVDRRDAPGPKAGGSNGSDDGSRNRGVRQVDAVDLEATGHAVVEHVREEPAERLARRAVAVVRRAGVAAAGGVVDERRLKVPAGDLLAVAGQHRSRGARLL